MYFDNDSDNDSDKIDDEATMLKVRFKWILHFNIKSSNPIYYQWKEIDNKNVWL